MVGRTTRIERATSNVDTASFTSSRTIPLPNGKDEGCQSVVNPISVPPITGTDLHYSYDPSDATTPALIPDGGMGSFTPSLPSTICPLLLQPTLQEFISLPEVDGRYSTAAKGKGKALTEDRFFSGQYPTNLGSLDDINLVYPSDYSSTDEWVEHTRPILQDYANRQIPLPFGQRVDVSLNEPSQFIHGALQLLANRDHPKNPPIDTSRRLGPQLIENFTDVHRWATEYFRTRFGMSTVGSDVPVLLTIITNTFYEAHTQLIDSIVDAALGNMRDRGAATLDIGDFAFGYDFKMSQQLPFAVESSSRIHDTLEQHRPRSPLELPVNLPVTTRSGRQIKVSKQAQEAALAESEKQIRTRQRKKEQAKKVQDSTTPRHETYKAVSQVTQKDATTLNPSTANVVVCTPSASIYHTPNNGSLYHTPFRGISGISRKAEANAFVSTGAKCPTCGRVMPPRMPMAPTNTHSASQSTAKSKALDTARHANTTATLLEATTGTQDSVPAQVPIRGGRLYLRARGVRGSRGDGRGRGRGRGGGTLPPLTIVLPARPRPVAPASPADPPASASTAVKAPTNAARRDPSGRSAGGSGTTSTHTANPVSTTAASSKARVSTSVRPGSVNTTGGADHNVTVATFAHTHLSRYKTSQIAAAGSNANASVDNTANSRAYASSPSSKSIFGALGPTSTGAYYPSTTFAAANATANAAAGPSRDRVIDFSDPDLWITRARSTGGLPGFVTQVPNSVTRPTVAAGSNRVYTTMASGSRVDTRPTKKRKLGDNE